MAVVSVLIKQISIMFLLIILGYILYKKKYISNQGSKELSKILVGIVIPCVIINSYITTDFSVEQLKKLGITFILSIISLIIAILVSYVCFGRRRRIENFGASFSNAGFMGIPLVQMVLGEEAVFFVAVFVALLNIFQWTYGLLIMTGDKSHVSFKKIVANPVFIALIIAFILWVIPLNMPEVMVSTISYVGSMNTPVAMLVLGVYLAQTNIITMFQVPTIWYCCVCRLILIPAITLLALWLIPLPENYDLLKKVVLIASITPVGSNVAIFAQLYESDYEHAVKIVCASTILCIITMPVVMYFAAYV